MTPQQALDWINEHYRRWDHDEHMEEFQQAVDVLQRFVTESTPPF